LNLSNIKVTPQGVVKVLDFGLAAMAQGSEAAGDPNTSPTLTMRATQTYSIFSPARSPGIPAVFSIRRRR